MNEYPKKQKGVDTPTTGPWLRDGFVLDDKGE